jgi:hypothetical protein
MTAVLSPPLVFQGLTKSGQPLVGGMLFTYVAGTSTPQPTYTDSTQTTPNTNPVILDASGQASVWLDVNLTYKLVLNDANNNLIDQADQVKGGINATQIAQVIWPLTPAESEAFITPTSFAFETQPYDIRRYGALLNGTTDDTQAVTNAIAVAAQPVGGSQGSAIKVTEGIVPISSMVNLPNRVRVLGNNKRGSYFQAVPTFSGPAVFNAKNGTQSMFDSTLENCTVDANSTGGCVLSDAWQDDCGTRGALLINFTTYGIKFQNGFGGADVCRIIDTEIFGGVVAGSVGIDLTTPLGSVAGFRVHLDEVVFAGGANQLAAGISCKGNSITAQTAHSENCVTGFLLDGAGFITLIDCDGAGGTSITNTLVTIAPTFTGSLVMINCRRNGSTNFIVDNRSGGYGTITYDIPFFVLNPADPNVAAKGLPFASAWCVFDGTLAGTNAPTAGYNVVSVTRTGTGRYTILLQRPMLSGSASVNPCANTANATWSKTLVGTTSVQIAQNVAGTATDSNEICVSIFGG